MLNIGWFSTGRDEAARQLLQFVQEKIKRSEIKGKISFVFSNRDPGEAQESDLFFELVHSYGIPLICFSHKKFQSLTLTIPSSLKGEGLNENWRLQYDREVDKRIGEFQPDLCVLAGYMLIVGEELCQKYNMINLHPAPPDGPTGSWQEVIRELIATEANKAGAMIHLVTPELDRGAVVSYCLFPIDGDPFASYWQNNDKDILFRLIREYELVREFPLITSTLQSMGQHDINIINGRVVNAQGKPINGHDLSAEIDQVVEDEIALLRLQ